MGNDKTPAMILKIQAMRAAMSKSELLVCDYIIQHPDEVIYLSVSELAAKSARLAELNAQLDMGAQRKPASRERGMVKSSRPSVLEGLKRPAPPRTAEKKHQEEVR